MTTDEHPSGILEEMTIEDVQSLDPEVVLLPVGSTEPHGPHLPYGTDAYLAEAVSRGATTRATGRGAAVLRYPTLPISTNANFHAYPFACRLGVRTFMRVILDIIDAIEQEGVRKIMVLNGHGGNPGTLQATLREHRDGHRPGEGAFVGLVNLYSAAPDEADARIEHPSDHAGESETSRMLHVRPDLVREDEFDEFPMRRATIDALESDRVFYVKPWHAYMPESAGGETSESSAEKGAAMIEGTADWLADLLVALEEAPMHELFPFPDE